MGIDIDHFVDTDGKERRLSDLFVTKDFFLEAAMRTLPGITTYNKFGRNIEVDSGVTADVWDGGYTLASGGTSLIWVAPTQARIHDIVSSDANDTAGGTGARTIRVYGLTDWATKETSEVITMNGTSNVPTKSYVIIHRMKVLTKGGTSVNVGNITATAQTDGTITAIIKADLGQTEMAVYGFPSTQTVYMGRLYANVNKAGGAAGLVDVDLCWNPEPDQELTNFLIKHTFGLQTVGTSAVTIAYYVPKIFEGPGILKVRVMSGTNEMDVSAGFDLILVDNI